MRKSRRPAPANHRRPLSSKPIAGTVSVGDTFEGRVRDLTHAGNAVVEHPQGQIFFVAGAWLDEWVRVRVTAFKKQLGFADLLEVLEPHADRIDSPCVYQGIAAHQCGGCPWMFVSYAAQLRAKQARVEQAVRRLNPLVSVQPIIPSAEELGYRVRAQLKTDGRAIGFVEAATRALVPIDDCLILTDANRATVRDLHARLPVSHWRPRRKQSWTTLDIDEAVDADTVSVNQRLPFQQANRAQNETMRGWLHAQLQPLARSLPVLELFSGSGNFTEVMVALGFESITAVEVVEQAVISLRARAWPTVRAEQCDLFNDGAFGDLLGRHGDSGILVLDPPRDGLKVKQALFAPSSAIRHVFYISCDVATFCRDLAEFCAHGFQLVEVQPVDLCPQTPHVELLAHLIREGA